MTVSKPWYASRTLWVGAVQVAVGTALASGLIDEATANDALGQAPEVVGGVVGAILGATQIYLRTQDTKPITGTTEAVKAEVKVSEVATQIKVAEAQVKVAEAQTKVAEAKVAKAEL